MTLCHQICVRMWKGKLAVHDAKWRYKITPEDIDRAVIDILSDVEKMVPPLTHPAVIQHPVTGRNILYISSGFTSGIAGLGYAAEPRGNEEPVRLH